MQDCWRRCAWRARPTVCLLREVFDYEYTEIAEIAARFVLASTRLLLGPFDAEVAELNGEPAIVIRTAERVLVALFFEIEGERVREIRAIGKPDKLQRI